MSAELKPQAWLVTLALQSGATSRYVTEYEPLDGALPPDAKVEPLYTHPPVRNTRVVGEMDRTAPPRVFLQIDTDGDNNDRSEPIPESAWMDLTWHYERIGGQEVEYIRADLAFPNQEKQT